MSEGIRRLIECEKRGKERINEALRAQSELKRRIIQENEEKRESFRRKYAELMRNKGREHEQEMERMRDEMSVKRKAYEARIDEICDEDAIEEIIDVLTLRKK